jgi:hypothetical protein
MRYRASLPVCCLLLLFGVWFDRHVFASFASWTCVLYYQDHRQPFELHSPSYPRRHERTIVHDQSISCMQASTVSAALQYTDQHARYALRIQGAHLVLDANGLPVFQGFTNVTFSVQIPNSLVNNGTAGRIVQYGHGLFGDQSEIEQSYLQVLAGVDCCLNEHALIVCGTIVYSIPLSLSLSLSVA